MIFTSSIIHKFFILNTSTIYLSLVFNTYDWELYNAVGAIIPSIIKTLASVDRPLHFCWFYFNLTTRAQMIDPRYLNSFTFPNSFPFTLILDCFWLWVATLRYHTFPIFTFIFLLLHSFLAILGQSTQQILKVGPLYITHLFSSYNTVHVEVKQSWRHYISLSQTHL